MQCELPAGTQSRADQMRVCVSAQQQDLEEEHAGSPDCRRSAKPRQKKLGHQQLDLEEQEGADENSGAESSPDYYFIFPREFFATGRDGSR
jgi:hypothetical protein